MIHNPDAESDLTSSYPTPNEYYKHWKGKLYRVEKLVTDADTNEIVVIYYSVTDRQSYARKLSSWLSPKTKDDGSRVRRFSKARR